MSGHAPKPDSAHGHDKPKEKHAGDKAIEEALLSHYYHLLETLPATDTKVRHLSDAIRFQVAFSLGHHSKDEDEHHVAVAKIETAITGASQDAARIRDEKKRDAALDKLRIAKLRLEELHQEHKHAPKPVGIGSKMLKGLGIGAREAILAPLTGWGYKYNPLAWPMRYLVVKPTAYMFKGMKEHPFLTVGGAIAGTFMAPPPFGTLGGAAAGAALSKGILDKWKNWKASNKKTDDHGGHGEHH